MSMLICPDCQESGSVGAELRPQRSGNRRTWCRTCYGSGLVREPDHDDEQESIELLWPESIRWTRSS